MSINGLEHCSLCNSVYYYADEDLDITLTIET